MKRRGFTAAVVALTAGCTGESNQETESSEPTTEVEIQWSYDGADQIEDFLAIGGAYYLLDSQDNLIKIDRQSGEQLWYTRIDHYFSGRPLTAGDFVVLNGGWNGEINYYMYSEEGKLQSQINSSNLTDSPTLERTAIGTGQHLIITMETREVGEDSNITAYIVNLSEGEVIDSKDWDTHAGISADTGDGHVVADHNAIQLVDDSYNPMWRTSAEYNELQQIAVSDEGEIIANVSNERSVGMIHITEDGQIINQKEIRGAPDEEFVFSTDPLTTEGVTILPTSTDPRSESTLRKYDHEQRKIIDSHSIRGNLLSIVPYNGDILIAIAGGFGNIGTEDGRVEFQHLTLSDFTRKKSWKFDSPDQGEIIDGRNDAATYIQSDTISRIELN